MLKGKKADGKYCILTANKNTSYLHNTYIEGNSPCMFAPIFPLIIDFFLFFEFLNTLKMLNYVSLHQRF